MPSSSAQIILNMILENKLHALKGKISTIVYAQDHYLVTKNNHEPIQFDYIINATGQSKDITKHPLYKHLLSQNLITKNHLNGIDVDLLTGRVIKSNKLLSNSMFAIGSKTIGCYINVNSAEMLSKQAKNIAIELFAMVHDGSNQ